jgi:hypothetical protein
MPVIYRSFLANILASQVNTLDSQVGSRPRAGTMASRCSSMINAIAFAAVLALGTAGPALASLLRVTGSIPLGSLKGAISDLEIDYANQRLFVLERDAGRLAVVDLLSGTINQTLGGLGIPHGLAHEPPNNQLYVALGNGKLAVFRGVPLQRTDTITVDPNLGPPRYDAGTTRVYFAYDKRKVGVIETSHNTRLRDIDLQGKAGPLVFEEGGSRLFVGAVDDKRILVVDRVDNKQVASWASGENGEAVVLALDEDAGFLLAAFRRPAGLAWFDLVDGSLKGRIDTCVEPGRLIVDGGRGRVYLTCGEGRIEVFQRGAGRRYAKAGAIDTEPGATAALLVPTSDRLYLAVPAALGRGAEIRVYVPND